MVWVITAPATEPAFETNKLIEPPAPVLLNAVTIELLLMVCVPVAEREDVLEIKMTLPVVFTKRFVKVLLLMFWDKDVPELVIYVFAFDPATEYVIP